MVAVSIFYEWYGYLYDDLGHGVCRTKNSDRKFTKMCTYYSIQACYWHNKVVKCSVGNTSAHRAIVCTDATAPYARFVLPRTTSLLCIANYIRSNKIKKQLKDFGEVVWSFISSIYESGWNILSLNKNNKSFRGKVSYKFTPKISRNVPSSNVNTNKSKDKSAEIVRLPPPILTRLPKEVLEKSKFFKKN